MKLWHKISDSLIYALVMFFLYWLCQWWYVRAGFFGVILFILLKEIWTDKHTLTGIEKPKESLDGSVTTG